MRSAYNYDDDDDFDFASKHHVHHYPRHDAAACGVCAANDSADDLLLRRVRRVLADWSRAIRGAVHNADDVPESGPAPEHPA